MRRLQEIVQTTSELGAGWSGKVFKGILLRAEYGLPPGSQVAVKFYRSHLLKDPKLNIRARIERELEAGRKRHDVRIVRSFELVEAEDDGAPTLALVMEYVAGPTLDKFIDENFPLDESLLLRISEELITAVAALHAVGLIHRDIKPQNIKVAEGRATLLDLGVLKAKHDGNANLTGSTEFLGTIRYADRDYLFSGEFSASVHRR